MRGQNDECFMLVWLLDVSVLQGPNFFFFFLKKTVETFIK